MAEVPQDGDFLSNLGGHVGAMDAAMATFWHPAAHRSRVWDLAHAAARVRANKAHVAGEERQKLVQRCLDRFEGGPGGRAHGLRRACVHNDVSDRNVVCVEDNNGAFRRRRAVRVAAVIDFGDLVHTALVHNVASMAAHAMLHKSDPMATMVAVVKGYHAHMPLEPAELEVR
eukprot:753296-Prorocentrum_minimum.AAC.1